MTVIFKGFANFTTGPRVGVPGQWWVTKSPLVGQRSLSSRVWHTSLIINIDAVSKINFSPE